METGKGRKHATSKGAPRQSCFLMQNAQNFFLFTYKKNNAIIINPNEDTQLAATFSKWFGGADIYKPTAGTKPGKQPLEFLHCHPFSLKETRGL